MDIQKLKDLPADELENVLQEATVVRDQTYYRPMDPAEVSIVENEHSIAAIERSYLEEEIKEAKAEFKARMEPIAGRCSDAIEQLKTKMRKITGDLYILADYDNKMMHTLDNRGNVINSRQMKPEERQLRFPSIPGLKVTPVDNLNDEREAV